MGLFSGIAKIFGTGEKSTLDEQLRAELAEQASQQPQMELAPQRAPGEFSVVLDAAGVRPITVLKTIKDQLNLDLKTAKDLVDAVPSVLVRDVDAAFAEYFVRALETAGAKGHLDHT